MLDIYRKEYKEVSKLVKDTMIMFKIKAGDLDSQFDLAMTEIQTDMRCMEIAKQRLEEAVMWAIKSIT